MIDELDGTATFEDLLAEEEFITEKPVIKAGISGNTKPEAQKTQGKNPNLTRWVFNPFEIIDLRNEPTSCGMDFLENVTFNKVKSLDLKQPNNSHLELAAGQADPTSIAYDETNYKKVPRTATMIADELCNKNGDKGVVDISTLVGQDDEVAERLNVLLFGNDIPCVLDLNDPERPCPVLPTLLEVMEANVKSLAGLDEGTKDNVVKTAKLCRESIALAMRNARARINDAQKRFLDEKNPNRKLSPAEERCYLALGEEIPNQMPMLTKSAVNNGIDANTITKAVIAGVQAARATSPMPAVAVAPATNGFAVSDADLTTAERTIGMGERVHVNGKKGTVVGKPGGRITVQFEDETKETVTKDQID
jgi:hypothetical protein